MIDTVILSNVVAKTMGVGLGAEGLNLHAPSDCLKRLGFHSHLLADAAPDGRSEATLRGGVVNPTGTVFAGP